MKGWTSLGVKREDKKIIIISWKSNRGKKETVGEYISRILLQVNAEEIK